MSSDCSRDPCAVEQLVGCVALGKPLVSERVSIQAMARAQNLAVADNSQKLTFAELEGSANQLAHHLRSLGVVPDTLVGICLGRSAAFIVAALAVLKAGGAYVCLDPAYPPDRLGFMLNDSQPTVVLTNSCTAKWLPAGKCQVLAMDNETGKISRCSIDPPSTSCKPENLAYVIYTSGSTGVPKGVEITHRSLLNLIEWHQSTFGITASDRATQLASVAFDAAVWELWPHLSAGASVHIPDEETRMSPEILRDWLVSRGITITFVPTPLCERLISVPWPRETALRIMLTGGDTLHLYPPAELPFALVNNYGPTECTVVATSGPVPPNQGSHSPPPIGRPIANTDILILDPQMRPVPVGEIGEIYIGGMGLARGYHKRPDLTAESFVQHPFSSALGAHLYRTGDLGCFLPDGQISFLGRRDEQIKVRGFRVEPDEITTVLNRHPQVQASVVICRGENAGEKQLIAYVAAVPGQEPTASTLSSHLGEFLPEYMIPSLFVGLHSIPSTVNGKIDRDALPVPSSTNILREGAALMSETAVEKDLNVILSRLLKLENVGPEDNFFLLGGHSLLGMQLITEIGKVFEVELTLPMLFERPTITGLASKVESLIRERQKGADDSFARYGS